MSEVQGFNEKHPIYPTVKIIAQAMASKSGMLEKPEFKEIEKLADSFYQQNFEAKRPILDLVLTCGVLLTILAENLAGAGVVKRPGESASVDEFIESLRNSPTTPANQMSEAGEVSPGLISAINTFASILSKAMLAKHNGNTEAALKEARALASHLR